MREKIKKYDKLVAFRLSSGNLRGLELIASKRKIGVSELLRDIINGLLNRGKK